ncbi:hypothetical protein RHMOL_Rhmol10G0147800 [Rhododendron molle]|uniref:Uncharacterized protein n=1 Tax=Rhododendron molle TaxID=49168 RepID=A0ACC0M3F7_RHOML|nr:hypothetical protein RHMOL_Rhmol10G0147800 [Rhododendron molle]
MHSQTPSTKVLTFRRQPPIRRPSPEVLPLALGFSRSKSVNLIKFEEIKLLRDQGGTKQGAMKRYAFEELRLE